MNEPKPLCEKLQQAMGVYRLSAADLAKVTGLTPASVSLLVSGKRPDPGYSTIYRLIQAMPVNMKFWFDIK